MTINRGSPITSPDRNNVLQSFTDSVAGNAMQLYWLMGEQALSSDYIMARDSGISTPAVKDYTANSQGIDFDITILKPTILSGRMYIDYTMGCSGGAGGAAQWFLTFTLEKYDGSSTTQIAQNVSPTQVFTAVADFTYKTGANLTKTKLNIGDILRLNVEASSSNYQRDVHFYFDPQTSGKEAKIWIPIRTFD